MPTGGKLIGAIVFALLAYFISDLIKPLLPEGTATGLFSPVNAIIGLVMGWRIMGRAAGDSYRQAFGYGFTTIAAIVFWCLLTWSGYEMIKRSMRLYYDGPIEALQDMASLALEYARLIAVQEVLVPAVVGTIFCAWLSNFFGRRWS